MSEPLGEFSLEHAGTTYAKDADGNIASYVNWKGSATGFGPVFGTLKTATPLKDGAATSGTCSFTGEAFPEGGTAVLGHGEGTWRQIEGEYKWKVEMKMEVSNGENHRSEGEIDLETLVYSGHMYPLD